MEKVQKKMIDLTEYFMSGLYYDREAFLNQEAYELGMEEGMKTATNDTKLEIAKKLILKGESISNISELLELSVNKINELKQNMKNI